MTSRRGTEVKEELMEGGRGEIREEESAKSQGSVLFYLLGIELASQLAGRVPQSTSQFDLRGSLHQPQIRWSRRR